MFSVVGWLAKRYAFALWYMMAMEESAKSLARDMVMQPLTKTLGSLDPAFAALHQQHMKDETRHVHIDALLIERCMDDRHATLNARLFIAMLAGVVRPTRGGSGVEVVHQLSSTCRNSRRGRRSSSAPRRHRGTTALSGEPVQSPHHAAHLRAVRRHAGTGGPWKKDGGL